jgi:hypothetical protein
MSKVKEFWVLVDRNGRLDVETGDFIMDMEASS